MQNEAGIVATHVSPGGKPGFGAARVGGGIAVTLGAAVLLGWCAGLPLLTTMGHGFVPMAPSTAVGFLVFGALVSLAAGGPAPPGKQRACVVTAAVGALASLLLGLLSWHGIFLDVEHLGLAAQETFHGAPIGHMSPLTALGFVLASLSLVALPPSRPGHSRRALAALGLALVLLVICIVFLLAYVYGSPLLYGGSVIPPALPTVLGLAALGGALLDLARHSVWPPGDEAVSGGSGALGLILVFMLVATGLLTAGYLFHHSAEMRYRAEVESGLANVMALKADELAQVRAKWLEEVSVFRDPGFYDLVRSLDDPRRHEQAGLQVEWRLKAYKAHPSYDSAILLDARGRVRIAVPGPAPVLAPALLARAMEAQRTGQTLLEDFYHDEQDHRAHLAVVIPVREGKADEPPLGVVVLRLDPEVSLYPCIRRWPAPVGSSRIMLIRTEGADALVLYGVPEPGGSPAGSHIAMQAPLEGALAQARGRGTGLVQGPDENGVPTVTCAQAVPGSPWFVVVRRSVTEVYGQLGERAWTTSIVIALLLAGTAGGIWSVWRNQRAWQQWEQARSADALRESEDRLCDMLEEIRLLAVSLDREGHVTFCNSHLLRLTGWSRDEVLGKDWFQMFVPQDGDAAQIFADAMAQGTVVAHHINPIATRDGRELAISWSNVVLRDARGQVAGTSSIGEDITERMLVEKERESMVDLLRLLNGENDAHGLMHSLTVFLKGLSGCEAVGIRLKDGEDYPYFETSGFPERFIQLENRLCARDSQGKVLRDTNGNALLDCMCGTVLRQGGDPALPYFTAHGSFWCNSTTELLASARNGDGPTGTRNRCHDEGYESVALVPLRSGAIVYGLIQFNDKRRGRFTPSNLRLLERMADSAAQALSERRARQELRESEASFRSLLASSSDHIFLLDAGGRFVLSNERREHVEVTPPGEITGSRLHDLFLGATQRVYAEHFGRVLEGSRAVDFEHELPGAEAVRILRTTLFPVLREGTVTGVGGITRDITDYRRMAERLNQMHKMDAIGQLAGGVAHDFNNQLAGVMGYADLLLERLEDPTLKRYADGIRAAAARSADLTGKLLAFARKGQYRAVRVDMHHVIAETVDMLLHSIDKRISIEQVLRAQTPIVVGDPPQLQNALLNLAVNARDAMPDGGTLTFETRTVRLDSEFCAKTPYEVTEGMYLRLSVSDTGCGMPDEVKRHLFEPFFTTKPAGRGTGMGLAAVYGTVKHHRGIVNVYTEMGRGTTFRLYLPAIEATSLDGEGGEESSPHPLQSLRILVVDDEPVVRGLAQELLQAHGHEVVLACDGVEATEIYRERWREIDLVILDMVMPRLGGRDTMRALKDVNPRVRALLSSGFSVNGEAQAILNEGVRGFIGKPFSWRDLEKAIARAMEG